MNFEHKKIPLSLIDFEDQTFRITTNTHIDDLLNSIKNVGLINPPILIKKRMKYIIICGFRRISVYRILGLSKIEAKVLATKVNKFDCIKFAISDNSFQRPLNLIEQSRALFMLFCFLKDITIITNAAISLGLPYNPSLIKKIINICNLPLPIQELVIANIVSLSMAAELSNFKNDAIIIFGKIFNELKLGLNKQREIVTLINEISLRENITVIEVMQESDFQKILQNDDLSRIQKTEKLRSYLKKKRYPSITHAEKKFEALVKKLKFGGGMKLIPPKNFEGNKFIIKLQFTNLKDFQNQSHTLNEILQNPILKQIFN